MQTHKLRYGKLFRGNKLQNCEKAGAIGVIMFSDPQDVTSRGGNASQVYPNSFFLPESGIQRGTTKLTIGDPLSLGWPSIKGAYRPTPEEVRDYLPKIPNQPIGYGDARRLLEVMGGEEVPEAWRGGLPGLTYRFGPGTNATSHPGWKVRLVTHNYLKDVVDTNVIGVIRGEEEPDRYVLFSNHRDAWGYGASDPSSGTAALMETARVLGNLHKSTGWRPRRTIVFASWAAEEYGMMGSIEWVHHHIQKLMDRAVAIINVDLCVFGDRLAPQASPILKEVFVEAIKAVPSTFDPSQSYYEFLEGYLAKGEKTKEMSVEEYVGILGSGSDHHEFAFFAGVPGLFFAFEMDNQKYPKVGFPYPTYHTGFETFHLMDKILDPGFVLHKSCSQLGMHMMLQLAESVLLPLATKHFVAEVEKGILGLEKAGAVQQLRDGGLGEPYETLVASIREFTSASRSWSERREEMQVSGQLDDPLKARMLNDQIMKFERVWIMPRGLPGREEIRHAIFSPAKHNLYGGAALPGISDLLYGVEELEEQERAERLLELRKHLSDLMILFKQAASWLQPFDHL